MEKQKALSIQPLTDQEKARMRHLYKVQAVSAPNLMEQFKVNDLTTTLRILNQTNDK